MKEGLDMFGEFEREKALLRAILEPYFNLKEDGEYLIAEKDGKRDLWAIKINPPTPASCEMTAGKVIELKPSGYVFVVSQFEDWVYALSDSLREKNFNISVKRVSPIDIGAMTAGFLPFSEHIGVAVRNLDEAEKKFEDVLGIKPSGRHKVETEGLTASFIWVGATRIELLEPFSDSSAVKSFLEKRGEGIHHIAVEVDDFDKKVEELKNKGYKIIGPRIGATGKRVVFIHPKDFLGILLELVEKGYRAKSFEDH
jgi:lactoylglutathione lyase/methylmalonyl-CoA/ethylmalonyl-CoA epimerase